MMLPYDAFEMKKWSIMYGETGWTCYQSIAKKRRCVVRGKKGKNAFNQTIRDEELKDR